MTAAILQDSGLRTAQRGAAKSPPAKTAKKPVPVKVNGRTGSSTLFSVFSPGAPHALLKKADFVEALRDATTMDLVNIERQGVPAQLFVFLSERMGVPLVDVLRFTGAPRSTALRKLSQDGRMDGVAGQAALGVTRLLAKAKAMAEDSTHPDAASLDTSRWLGAWIRKPQPALGGRRPEELLDTPTGIDAVMRVLGAIQSGASI